MLTKHNVCLFIKDEEHLEEMRRFLESKGENINNEGLFNYSNNSKLRFIQFYSPVKDWYATSKAGKTEVTTEQFKKLFI